MAASLITGGHALRLAKRLALVGADSISIAGAAAAVWTSLGAKIPAFTLGPQQAFRFYEPTGFIADPLITGFLSVGGPILNAVINPATDYFILCAFTPEEPLESPIATAGVCISRRESRLLYYADYAGSLSTGWTQVGLDLQFDASNSDAGAHVVQVNVQSIVEVYDIWDEHMLTGNPIGYGGPVRYPTT